MLCEKVDMIENETHTLFIGKIIEADVFNDLEPMSYSHYQSHKDEILKVKTEDGKTAWICTICGYIYYGDSIDDDFRCPICGADKYDFKIKEN